MCRQMRFRKHIFIKTTAFVLVCCMLCGSVCIPIFAEEETRDLYNAADVPDRKQESVKPDKAADRTGNAAASKDKEESGKDGDGTDTSKDTEESGKGGEGTDTGKDTEESGKDEDGTDTGKDTEELGKDEDGTDTGKDTEESGKDGEGKDTGKDTEESGKNEEGTNTSKDTVSGNDAEKIEKEEEKESVSGNDIGTTEKEEQEIIDVVVPSAYMLALNPYRLPIRTGEDETTTKQVIAGTYGIVNKSSTDQIVTVSLTVEDHSGEELLFVDSAEEAENAGMNVYAIYLAVVPADEEQILIEDEPVDGTVTAQSLQNVGMIGAEEQAVTLYAGDNQISFKLSKAVYGLEAEEEETENVFHELASDGRGVTAYTFSGVMNPNAEWEKLSGGIKLSVVYTYRTADGDEEIVEGTGALINTDEIFARIE